MALLKLLGLITTPSWHLQRTGHCHRRRLQKRGLASIPDLQRWFHRRHRRFQRQRKKCWRSCWRQKSRREFHCCCCCRFRRRRWRDLRMGTSSSTFGQLGELIFILTSSSSSSGAAATTLLEIWVVWTRLWDLLSASIAIAPTAEVSASRIRRGTTERSVP